MEEMDICTRCGKPFDYCIDRDTFNFEYGEGAYESGMEGMCYECACEFYGECMPAGQEVLDMLGDDD